MSVRIDRWRIAQGDTFITLRHLACRRRLLDKIALLSATAHTWRHQRGPGPRTWCKRCPLARRGNSPTINVTLEATAFERQPPGGIASRFSSPGVNHAQRPRTVNGCPGWAGRGSVRRHGEG